MVKRSRHLNQRLQECLLRLLGHQPKAFPRLMGGKELAYWLRAVSPDTRVLFTSGYTDRSVISSGTLNVGTRFLQKPFPPSTLANEVRVTLDC